MSISGKLAKGYTFIEILAVTAIFSGMMIIAVATFSIANSQETTVSNRRLVHQSARIGVNSLIRELAVSKNQYSEETGTIIDGGGAFVITTINSLGSSPPTNQADETSGNSIVLRTTDKNGDPIYRAYFICPHADNASVYSLVMENLGIANNFNTDWSHINNTLSSAISSNCLNNDNIEQITTADVKIPSGGLKISGYFPQSGLTTQPRVTVTLTAQNARGTRAEEQVLSTYRATAIHRDYGQY